MENCMKRLSIMYVSNGDSLHIKPRISWMIQKGHHISLVSQKPAIIDGLREFRLIPDGWNIPKLKYLGILLNIRKIANIVSPDIVHVSYMDSSNMIAGLTKRCPLVLTGWGSDVRIGLSDNTSGIMRYILRRIIHKADMITAVSDEIKEVISHYTTGEQDVYVQRFGVDVSLFKPIEDVEGLKKKHGLAVGDVIVFCPRLSIPVCNHELLLKAIPIIKSGIKNIKFIMRSPGISDVSSQYDYFDSLKKLANELNIEKYIIYKSLLSRSDLIELYNVSDVVVSVSKADGSPLSVLEAMACETPVVCGDINSLREIIEDGKNGHLVPVDDSEKLANVMMKLLGDKGISDVVKKEGREFVLKNANFEKEMVDLENNYYKLLRCQ